MKSYLNKLKVGDVVTAYRKGWHIITDIKYRYVDQYGVDHNHYKGTGLGEPYNSIIFYTTLVNSKFKEVKSKKVFSCDEAWCKLVNPEKEISELLNKIKLIRELSSKLIEKEESLKL